MLNIIKFNSKYVKELNDIKGSVTVKDIQELNKQNKIDKASWGGGKDREDKWHINGDRMGECYSKQKNDCVFLIMNMVTGKKYFGESINLPRITDGLSEVFGENFSYDIGCGCLATTYHSFADEADDLYDNGTKTFMVKLLNVNVHSPHERERLVRAWRERYESDELYAYEGKTYYVCSSCKINYDPDEKDGREEYWE